MLKSPSFYIAVGIVAIGIFFIEQWHYAGTISEMGATITQKDATITTISEERNEANIEIGNLRNSHTNYYAEAQAQTNAMPSLSTKNSRPKFDLYLNSEFVTNDIAITLGRDRRLYFEIYDVGTEDGTNVNLTVFFPFDKTNFIVDGHWAGLYFTQPIPINHKMYDMSGSFYMQLTSINPLTWVAQNNGFDVTAFNIAPTLQPVSFPIKKMQEFGMMLDSNSSEPVGSFVPMRVTTSSSNSSETNEYYIFLKF